MPVRLGRPADVSAAATVGCTWLHRELLVGRGRVRVERMLVQRHLDRPAREMLRVRRGTYLVAELRTRRSEADNQAR